VVVVAVAVTAVVVVGTVVVLEMLEVLEVVQAVHLTGHKSETRMPLKAAPSLSCCLQVRTA
jgi:hypothetical protein